MLTDKMTALAERFGIQVRQKPQPRLRTDELSDDEVAQAILDVPTHAQYLLAGNLQLTIAGKAYNAAVSIDAEHFTAVAQTLPIAWAGSITTWTSDTVAILTMSAAGHLIATGDKIDLYWIDVNGFQQCLHNVLVGTVAGVSVPITVPVDAVFPEQNLPPLNTVVQAAIFQVFGLNFVGTNLDALLVACDVAAAQFMFLNATPLENLQVLIGQPANVNVANAYHWLGQGPNPLAGVTPTTLWMSHNDIQTPRECRVAALMSS